MLQSIATADDIHIHHSDNHSDHHQIRNCEAQVSRFKNIYAYVHQQKRHFSLLKHKYSADFKAKNNAADKESDVLKQKDVVVAKLHIKNELTAHS
jgi:ribosomal protein S15P/S13E